MNVLFSMMTIAVGIRVQPVSFSDKSTTDDVKENRKEKCSFKVGSKVEIRGLENDDWQGLNGKTGTIVGPSDKNDSEGNLKLVVKLDESFVQECDDFGKIFEELPFKQENLVNISENEKLDEVEDDDVDNSISECSTDELTVVVVEGNVNESTPPLETATNNAEDAATSPVAAPSPRDYDDSAASILDLGSSFRWISGIFETNSPTLSESDKQTFEASLPPLGSTLRTSPVYKSDSDNDSDNESQPAQTVQTHNDNSSGQKYYDDHFLSITRNSTPTESQTTTVVQIRKDNNRIQEDSDNQSLPITQTSAPRLSQTVTVAQAAPVCEDMQRDEISEPSCTKVCEKAQGCAASLFCAPCVCYKSCTGDDNCNEVWENAGSCATVLVCLPCVIPVCCYQVSTGDKELECENFNKHCGPACKTVGKTVGTCLGGLLVLPLLPCLCLLECCKGCTGRGRHADENVCAQCCGCICSVACCPCIVCCRPEPGPPRRQQDLALALTGFLFVAALATGPRRPLG